MQVNNLFQFPLYEFTCDAIITESIIESIQKLKYHKVDTKQTSDDTNIRIPMLTDWIKKCLRDVQKTVYPDLQGELVPVAIWSNQSNKLQYHKRHSHANSLVSGIMYLTESIKGGETIFYYPDPYWKLQNDGYFILGKTDNPHEIQHSVKPQIGKTIIFPSTIQHSVTPCLDTQPRYTIAFNAFISGKFGSAETATGLHINSCSYEGTVY